MKPRKIRVGQRAKLEALLLYGPVSIGHQLALLLLRLGITVPPLLFAGSISHERGDDPPALERGSLPS